MNIIGQSFMLHQIRKMVGLAIATVRGAAGSYVLAAALSPSNTVHVPMAPEGGLFLERCVFEAYNARWGHEHDRLDLAQYSEQVTEFKVGLCVPPTLSHLLAHLCHAMMMCHAVCHEVPCATPS